MASLHGLGATFYNVFASALVEFPAGPLEWGRTWTTESAVKMAHCDQVPFTLLCRLEPGRSRSGETGYAIEARASLGAGAAEHLGKPGMPLGQGRWWISPDQKRVQGTVSLVLPGKLTWRDEIDVRPLGR